MKKYLISLLILSAIYCSGLSQKSLDQTAGLHASPIISDQHIQQDLPKKTTQDPPIILRGTIILPGNVLKHGYVAIVGGRIASISEKAPDLPKANTVNTNGIILPGFVDVHNHVPFNVLPRWKPGRLFTNRNQWRTDPEVNQKINGPMDRLKPYICDMNDWSELRALIGGTTSIMVTQPVPCITGMVRNLDLNSGFYGTTQLGLEHIINVLDLPPASNPVQRVEFVGLANYFIHEPYFEALFIHLAEGTDAASEEEFTFMNSNALVNPKGAAIHGIPLTPSDFQAMGTHGTALVWSPRSNIELYGTTANINAALDANVDIALAPDWAITGSSNMLNELKVAAEWNKKRLGGRLTNRQLVDMATSIPAHVAGVDDEVGSLKVGLRADIIVIDGNHKDPFQNIIDATAAGVNLVFIDGVPLYGDRKFMKQFWASDQLEDIVLPEATKTLATPAANRVVAAIKNRLQPALQAEGTSLAPLTENGAFTLPTTVARSGEQSLSGAKEVPGPTSFSITVLNNPSRSNFTIKTKSSSSQTMQLRILDGLGSLVDVKTGIAPNTTFSIGNQLKPGVYLIELMQGNNKKVEKLIRL